MERFSAPRRQRASQVQLVNLQVMQEELAFIDPMLSLPLLDTPIT